MKVGAALEKARVSLEARDFANALESLLEAWRLLPSMRLAELIDHVSLLAHQQAALPSLRKKPLSAQWEEWKEVASRKRALDFERLVDVPMPRKWADATVLLGKLTDWKDPRVARYLHRLMVSKTIYEIPSDPRPGQIDGFHWRLRSSMVAIGDKRFADWILEQIPEMHRRERYSVHDSPTQWSEVMELKARPEPEGVTAQFIEELFTAYGPRSSGASEKQDAESLLTRIYEHPDDLGLRAVYADVLTSAGDERGEFISLQLAGKGTAREKKLLKPNVRGWAGPLDAFFGIEERIYEHGFFAGGRLKKVLGSEDMTLREWRLVRHLDLRLEQPPEPWLLKALPSLRSLEFFYERDLQHLLAASWPFTALKFFIDDEEANVAERLTSGVLPKLEHLTVTRHETTRALAWLARAPVVKQCKRLTVNGVLETPSQWWEPFNANQQLQRLELRANTWQLVFERDEAGRLARVTGRPLYSSTDTDSLLSVLRLGPGRITSFTFEGNAKSKKVSAELVASALKSL